MGDGSTIAGCLTIELKLEVLAGVEALVEEPKGDTGSVLDLPNMFEEAGVELGEKDNLGVGSAGFGVDWTFLEINANGFALGVSSLSSVCGSSSSGFFWPLKIDFAGVTTAFGGSEDFALGIIAKGLGLGSSSM